MLLRAAVRIWARVAVRTTPVLAPLLLVAAGAKHPEGGIYSSPSGLSRPSTPTRNTSMRQEWHIGLIQAFSMQLHPTSNQLLDANSKSSYLMLMVLVVAPTNMHVRASQRSASCQVRREVRAAPHGHFGPPEVERRILLCFVWW